MDKDEPAGQGVVGRAASWWRLARARRQAAEVAHGKSSPERRDRRAVIAYRVAAAALLATLAAADFAGLRLEHFRLDNSTSTADSFADSAVYCAIMLGISYYLGRTRYAPDGGQRLNRRGQIISVIPIWGLVQIAGFQGLTRLTRRRLCARNIAITAGSVLVWSSWDEVRRPVTGSVAMAVLQVAGIALAVLMSRRMPAAGLQPTGTVPRPASDTAPAQPRPAAEITDNIPAADQIIDVSALAAGTRRMYWLAGSVKFGAVVLGAFVVAHNHLLPGWGIAGAGVLAALAIAMLMQEDRIRPTAGLALALGLVSAICFVSAAFGVLTSSDAGWAMFLWGIWPLLLLGIYQRKRRSSGLSDAEIQAAGRVGHLPVRQANPAGYRMPPPRLWIRGIIGMLGAVVMVVASLINTVPFFSVPVISGWIQGGLDKLYALARDSVDALLAGAGSEERIIVTLATPPQPGMWQLHVRGDLLRWGKLYLPLFSPLSVPFGEFLRARLEVYGEVRTIQKTPCCPGSSIVVMPVGVPYPPDALDEVAALGTLTPLLLPVQPMGSIPLQKWPLLARQMRDRGIVLPAMDNPVQTIAVLHQPTGKNVVFTAQKRNQWGYIALIHKVFRALDSSGVPRPTGAPQADSGRSAANLLGLERLTR